MILYVPWQEYELTYPQSREPCQLKLAVPHLRSTKMLKSVMFKLTKRSEVLVRFPILVRRVAETNDLGQDQADNKYYGCQLSIWHTCFSTSLVCLDSLLSDCSSAICQVRDRVIQDKPITTRK